MSDVTYGMGLYHGEILDKDFSTVAMYIGPLPQDGNILWVKGSGYRVTQVDFHCNACAKRPDFAGKNEFWVEVTDITIRVVPAAFTRKVKS